MHELRRRLHIVLVLLLGFGRPLAANPTVIGSGFSPPEFTALLAETLVVALLLAACKFDFIRAIYTWFCVTLLTYWFLMLGAGLTLAGLEGVLGAAREPQGPVLLVLLVFEVMVVAIEAGMIVVLAGRKFWRKADRSLGWKPALAIAAAGNSVSIAVGMSWVLR